tara:strand:+ start:258 stop:1430 length:1173 start_codon:yes stop_codon:yes gene_type:complete
MINKLTSGLLSFSILNIIDKFFIFALPFYILYLTGNKDLYNQVEYIFSVAALLIIFFEFGIKNYFFYGYKIENDKRMFIDEITSLFNFLIILYSSIFLFLLFFLKNEEILLFIFLKIIQTMLTTFYFTYFRIIDKPSSLFLFTIPINLMTFIIIFLLKNFEMQINLISINYIVVLVLFILIFHFLNQLLYRKKINFNIIPKALRYSYPIMINLILIVIINHFGKIYSYNYLSEDEMFQISSIQRISTLILLVHTSLVGFFTKKLFISKDKTSHVKIFSLYLSSIISISIAILGISFVINQLDVFQINFFLLTTFVLGTIMWCFNAYCEIYFNSDNKNIYIPIINSISLFFYLFIFFLIQEITILKIAQVYLFSNFMGSITTLIFLTKIRR